VPLANLTRLTLGPGGLKTSTLWQVELIEAQVHSFTQVRIHPKPDPRSWLARAAQHEDALRSQAHAKSGRPCMAPCELPQPRPLARASATHAPWSPVSHPIVLPARLASGGRRAKPHALPSLAVAWVFRAARMHDCCRRSTEVSRI